MRLGRQLAYFTSVDKAQLYLRIQKISSITAVYDARRPPAYAESGRCIVAIPGIPKSTLLHSCLPGAVMLQLCSRGFVPLKIFRNKILGSLAWHISTHQEDGQNMFR